MSSPRTFTIRALKHFSAPRRGFGNAFVQRARHDDSTIDYAVLPVFPMEQNESPELANIIRVPILPTVVEPQFKTVVTPQPDIIIPGENGDLDIAVHRPVIHTISGSDTHFSGGPSAMSDLHDAAGDDGAGHGRHMDFEELADKITASARGTVLGVEREHGETVAKAQGIVRQVWKGLLDDVFGEKRDNEKK